MQLPSRSTGLLLLIVALLLPPGIHALHDAGALPSARPRVLLIGDSISKGYAPYVRLLMMRDTRVYWPEENCHATVDGLANLDRWLGDEPWDVIHFNFGLHDLKWLEDGRLAMPGRGAQNVRVAEYEANLDRIVTRLEATGATLVWATTTPVPRGARGRAHGDAARYNAAAARVVARHGIAVDDLHAYISPDLTRYQKPDDVHFTRHGYFRLARQVADSLQEALRPSPEAPPQA